MDNLYARGNPVTEIDLGNGRWLVTADSPKSPNSSSPEDEQIRRILGKVDHDLKKLADACVQDCPDTRTLLITRDKNLRIVARADGHSVISVSNLRESEVLEKVLWDTISGEPTDSKDAFEKYINSDGERIVNIRMTLEELRSEGDYFIARGSGRLTDGEEHYPFRWTFPYKNLATYNLSEDEVPISSEYAVMPLENVDFMGADEGIPEDVRRYVCSILEDEHESKALQTPITRMLWYLNFHTAMAMLKGQPYGYRAEVHKRGLSPEEAERYDKLSSQHDHHMQSLFDGSAKSVGSVYRTVLELNEELEEILGWDEGYDLVSGPWDLETALTEFLDDALGTWSVGETREKEYPYKPYEWPEDEEEATIDDEEEVGEESQ